MLYFIANWKANKNLNEMRSWLDTFFKNIDKNSQTKKKIENGTIKIIICPPSPLLYPLKQALDNRTGIAVGCQDISIVEGGTYTGEVTAHNLESLVDYTIVGHSERKKYFGETNVDVLKKYSFVKKYGIEPIYCVASEHDSFPSGLDFICYEPPAAISKGDAKGSFESSEKILTAKKKLRVQSQMKFIYGGSVNRNNVIEYLKHREIDGFLIGGASLDPIHFFDIIRSA